MAYIEPAGDILEEVWVLTLSMIGGEFATLREEHPIECALLCSLLGEPVEFLRCIGGPAGRWPGDILIVHADHPYNDKERNWLLVQSGSQSRRLTWEALWNWATKNGR